MREVFDAVAVGLEYPYPGSAEKTRAAADTVRRFEGGPAKEATVQALENLAVWVEQAVPGEPEERYSRLFDLSPVCTLNLGYHLFGESYERGALLAGLTSELAAVGLTAGDEIPDHLTVLLRLLGRLSPEDARILLNEALLPGLAQVLTKLAQSTDPWSEVIRALTQLLAQDAARSLEVAAHA